MDALVDQDQRQKPWSIGLKPWERAAIEEAARLAGKLPGPWARNVLLTVANTTIEHVATMRDSDL